MTRQLSALLYTIRPTHTRTPEQFQTITRSRSKQQQKINRQRVKNERKIPMKKQSHPIATIHGEETRGEEGRGFPPRTHPLPRDDRPRAGEKSIFFEFIHAHVRPRKQPPSPSPAPRRFNLSLSLGRFSRGLEIHGTRRPVPVRRHHAQTPGLPLRESAAPE